MYPEVFFRYGKDWTSDDAEQILRGSVAALNDYLTDYEDLFLAEVVTFGDEAILTLAGMFAKLTEIFGGNTDDWTIQYALRRRQNRIDEGADVCYGEYKEYDWDLPDHTWMDYDPRNSNDYM